MKKNLYCLILVLAVIFSCVTPAYARMERSLTLDSIFYVRGKGVIFTFTPHGDFKESKLIGTATINHQTFALDCHFNDFGDVKCTTDRGLSSFVGQIAVGQVAGFSFWGVVRAGLVHPTLRAPYCYSIFDRIGGDWETVSSFCWRYPARKGDWVLYRGRVAVYNPNGPAGSGFYL
jgi:hypothetical protein